MPSRSTRFGLCFPAAALPQARQVVLLHRQALVAPAAQQQSALAAVADAARVFKAQVRSPAVRPRHLVPAGPPSPTPSFETARGSTAPAPDGFCSCPGSGRS
ncbi:hypothetical protein CNMCM5623_005340 [Aspergillus felis]|uniref:Uncharacterized protein n=1 Tax=Aspergillus felis TaxID=1287682 RepID=A0A8H6QIZ9_9EURO|nr:hypothetical protein CNMCM5623_005340 [Aspergillus felis]